MRVRAAFTVFVFWCVAVPAFAGPIALPAVDAWRVDLTITFSAGDACGSLAPGDPTCQLVGQAALFWEQDFVVDSTPILLGDVQILPAVQDGSSLDVSWIVIPPGPPARLFFRFGGTVTIPSGPPALPSGALDFPAFAFANNQIPPGPPATPPLVLLDDVGFAQGPLIGFDDPTDIGSFRVQVSDAAVPEPASFVLIGSGLFGAGVKRWKASKRRSRP